MIFVPTYRLSDKNVIEMGMHTKELAYLTEGTSVVYPGKGIGVISSITQQHIAGHALDVVVIYFEESKMNITIPLKKVKDSGMRAISSGQEIEQAFKVLGLPTKASKLPWVRRHEQYEEKINSGRVDKLAEALRDLNHELSQTEGSYSKRILYKKAMDRMIQEISLTKKMTETEALTYLESLLKQ